MPFAIKKEITSALRRLAPIGLSTDILWTANVRTLRHVIEMRTAPGAEEELRTVFNLIAETMKAEAPNLFRTSSVLMTGPGRPSGARSEPERLIPGVAGARLVWTLAGLGSVSVLAWF